MRYSKCMQAGKQLANLKTIVHTQLSKHLVYELGETLYSGPPSTKEAEGNYVSPPLLPSTTGFGTEEPVGVWLTSQDQDLSPKDPIESCVPSRLPTQEPHYLDEVLLLQVSSEDIDREPLSEGSEGDPLVLEEDSNGVDGVLVTERALSLTCAPPIPHNGNRDPPTASPRVAGEKGTIPSRRPSTPGLRDVNLAMVRLIQEPKIKADSQTLRRAPRPPPKRGSSLDCIDSTGAKTSKQSQKELRNRRVSCCPSDRSDSETSFDPADDLAKGATAVRRPRNGETLAEDHLPLGGDKLNGEVIATPHAGGCALNGVTSSKPVKVRRVSRTNSDDSDVVSWTSPKPNGVVDPPDNDRVDINLLLEISAKDRKRFENKKAKIKRKCADWMLITETEQYYNEKEEILRKKSREEEEEDEDEEEDEESESDTSEGSACGGGGRSNRKATSDRRKPSENDQVDRSRSGAKKDAKKTAAKIKKKESHRDEDDSTSSRKVRGRPRTSRNMKDLLSTLEEEAILFVSEGSSRATKGKGKCFSDKEKDSKPRKRLSDAERFLRDNREYYQFPETRDRLRRNISYGTKEQEELATHEEESENQEVGAETKVSSQPAVVDSVCCSSATASKNRKGKSSKGSSKETKENVAEAEKHPETAKPQPESMPAPAPAVPVPAPAPPAPAPPVPAPPPPTPPPPTPVPNEIKSPDKVRNETLDNLYFSFEGAPVQETWYQTYQRFIDGAENNEFVYPQETLQFILPYEMPKEYFKDLYARKTLLAKRKNELSDLVRKSPRCHASTLALFSNIFPTKKKKKPRSSSLSRTEEISSDGASTPIPETSSAKPPLMSDTFETEEELLFIGQCMEQIMKSALEENLSSQSFAAENTATRESRKSSSSKRRAKGKKGNAPHKGTEKMEIPLESKVFDNPLAAEVDSQFLFGLPRYLEEVSIVPEDTLCKNSVDLLSESCHCECTERTSCDEASSVDERTEVSSESLSVCDSETVDSFNSNFSVKVRKSGPPFKKRRKNLTGWPTRKKRRPAASSVAASASASAASTPPFDDNDNSSFGFDDHETMTSSSSKKATAAAPSRSRTKTRRPFAELLEPCSDLNLDAVGHDRRASPRKRSSVLYMDTWPLRFRHNHK